MVLDTLHAVNLEGSDNMPRKQRMLSSLHIQSVSMLYCVFFSFPSRLILLVKMTKFGD